MSYVATIPLLLVCSTFARKQAPAPVPESRAVLVGVINQALPTAALPAGTAPFTCEVTWELHVPGPGVGLVAPGCPMEAEVESAAAQWRFG